MKALQWLDRNKWFIVACVFLGINAFGIFYRGSPGSFGGQKLFAEFKPGADAEFLGRDCLTWIFTEPMVSEGRIGDEAEGEPVVITPAVEGSLRWIDRDCLQFKPSANWPPASTFTAKLADNIKSVAGSRLMSPRSCSFHTEALCLKSISQADWTAEGEVLLKIQFNQKVSPKVLEKYLQVQDTGNKDLQWTLPGDVVSDRILLKVSCGSRKELKIRIRQGFYGEDGPLPFEKDMEYAVAIEAGLALTSLSVGSPSYENPSITAHFSRAVDLESLRRSITIEPSVRFTVEEQKNWWYGKRYVISGDFAPGRNCTISFEKGLKSQDGRARLEQDIVKPIFITDRTPDIKIRLQGHYLSPSGNLLLPLTSVNLDEFEVSTARVFPNNLVQYAMRSGGHYSRFYGTAEDDISAVITSRTYKVKSVKNEIRDHEISLKDVLPEDPHGAYVVTLRRNGAVQARRLMVVTDTGIAVKQSAGQLLVWANSIHTLEAVTNGHVQVWSEANQLLCEGYTDGQGLAVLSLSREGALPFLVSIQQGQDLSFLNLTDTRLQPISAEGSLPYLSEGYEAFVYSDRGIYRPGETAHIRAVVRGSRLACPAEFPVELQIRRPDGRLHSTLHSMLSSSGTAEFEAPWADYDATGSYRMELKVPGSDRIIGETVIAVEDFVPPRMAVDAALDQSVLSAGDNTTLRVKARYLYGAPAAGNSVSARMEVVPAAFQPKEWSEYVFGDREKSFTRITQVLGSGNLDPEGAASFAVKIPEGWTPPASLQAMFSASAAEQGGRTVTDFTRCDIHPYPFYIGLRSRGRSLRPGDDLSIDVALVNPSGTSLEEIRKLNTKLDRVSWSTVLEQDRHGKYHYKSVRRLTREREEPLETDGEGRAVYAAAPAGSGEYLLRIVDQESGSSSSYEFYVGGDHDRWQSRSMEQPDSLKLALDRETCNPGETVVLTVTAPFRGKALLCVEQDQVVYSAVQQMSGNTAEFRIPVTTNLRPNAHASVSVIREVAATGMQDVYRATGSIPILLDKTPVSLAVAITAPEEIRPLTKLDVTVSVRDAEGLGQEAEVALAAVDEGICMLTDFKTPDPVDFFTALRKACVEMSDLYSMLMPETSDELSSVLSHTGGDLGRLLRGRLNPVKSRRFKPVALWSGGVMTDSNGLVQISLDIPEFSGTMRLMAVAVSRDRFGSADQQVMVRRPFTVLSTLPRFLAPGDRCTMPVELHNATGGEGEAVVEILCKGPAFVDGNSTAGKHMKNNERIPLEFAVEAGPSVGPAEIRLKASLGDETVEEVVEIPVRPASPLQSVYGTVAVPAGESTKLSFPGRWLKGTGRYELQYSALPSVKLKGGLEYLLRYPYGCLEQTTSSMFPLLYLADLVNQPGSPVYVGDVSSRVASGISRILSMQLGNGGFGYWPHQTKNYEWGSIYAAHFLIEARKAGYRVPQSQLDAATGYLKGLLERNVASPGDLQSAEWKADAALRSYACHVLALAGKPEHGWVARLREQARFLNYDSRLHLVMALAASGMRRDAWNELQAAGGVPVGVARLNGDSLSSPSRSAALLLSAWMEFDPENENIPALVKQVESHMRDDGYWYTTQENALALMALGKYMRHTASEARSCAGYMIQKGTRSEIPAGKLPMKVELSGRDEVEIVNEGPGTMYCGWMSEGVPEDPQTEAMDNGLSIRRSYVNLDQKPVDASPVKQGTLLVVQLTINTLGRRLDNIVIDDLLPAGFEIENANLKTSELVAWAKKASTLPVRHLEMRDDRVVIFADAFSGEKKFYYAVRAVSPGEFILPAVSASAMYDPAVKSIHGAGRITVTGE